nr:alpha/beta fold hydrolase [bacterium]
MALKPTPFINSRHIGFRISLDGEIEVHYLAEGQGRPLILVHGMMQSLYTWRESIPYLSEDARVFALDLPGNGYSDCPALAYTVEDYVQLLITFMDDLGLGQADFIGVGQGASYVMALALAYPDRVRRIVAVSPGGMTRGYPFAMRMLRLRTFGEIAAHYMRTSTIENYLLRAYFDETRVDKTMVEQTWLPLELPGAREALTSTVRNFSEGELLADIHRLQARVLLVWGEHDAFHPAALMEGYQREMPHIETWLAHSCGHLVHEERPREFNARVRAFLLSDDSQG